MTRVKICGLTNLADAQFAADCGADFLGFVFYPPSPRYVSPEQVQEIVQSLIPETLKPRLVGVFVNQSADFIRRTLDECRLHLAQLHGDESAEFTAQFGGRAFKAVNPQSLAEAETAAEAFIIPPDGFILLDAFHPTLRGGSGLTADWAVAAQIAVRRKILLAGGLTPENVAQAVQAVTPWAVDVSSGVEASKGRKDPEKVKAFIQAVQAADGNRQER